MLAHPIADTAAGIFAILARHFPTDEYRISIDLDATGAGLRVERRATGCEYYAVWSGSPSPENVVRAVLAWRERGERDELDPERGSSRNPFEL